MNSATKLTAQGATDAKTLANSMFARPESNGRLPGPGVGQKPCKSKSNFMLLSRAILGLRSLVAPHKEGPAAIYYSGIV